MEVIVAGIVMEVNPVAVHAWKEELPIEVILDGRAHEVKAVQDWNAEVGIVVIPVRPETVTSFVEDWKQLVPMEVIVDGIVMEVKPVFWKARLPIEVILEGRAQELRLVQDWNVLSGILVNPVNPVTVVSEAHDWKQLAPKVVTEAGILIDVNPVA